MRCLFVFLLLSACSESHLVGDFDSGPRRDDAGPGFDVPRLDAPGFDAPSFDAPSFDVSRFDVPPRRDAGARDTGPRPPVVDAGAPPLDIPFECIALCERAVMCIPDTQLGDCVGGCIDIQDLVSSPLCESLADDIFRCAEGVPCEELERAFDGGECGGAIQNFGDSCGEL